GGRQRERARECTGRARKRSGSRVRRMGRRPVQWPLVRARRRGVQSSKSKSLRATSAVGHPPAGDAPPALQAAYLFGAVLVLVAVAGSGAAAGVVMGLTTRVVVVRGGVTT